MQCPSTPDLTNDKEVDFDSSSEVRKRKRPNCSSTINNVMNVRALKSAITKDFQLNNLGSIIIDLYPNSSERYIKI